MEGLDLLLDLVMREKWVAASAIVIGAVARLAKAGKVPILSRVPASDRPTMVMGLGVASGVLDAMANGTPWGRALVGGVVAACVAMGGHALLIDALRGGRELGTPKPKPEGKAAEGPATGEQSAPDSEPPDSEPDVVAEPADSDPPPEDSDG